MLQQTLYKKKMCKMILCLAIVINIRLISAIIIKAISLTIVSCLRACISNLH